jgi:hypothetical protein
MVVRMADGYCFLPDFSMVARHFPAKSTKKNNPILLLL